MTSAKTIEAAVAGELKAAGFKKSGTTWRRAHDEQVDVVNLQSSQFSAQRYLNVGVFIPSLGGPARPAERHCHLRTRLSTMSLDRSDEVAALFDPDSNLPEETDRGEEIAGLVREVVLPFFEIAKSDDLLRNALKDGSLTHVMVHKKLRQRLGE